MADMGVRMTFTLDGNAKGELHTLNALFADMQERIAALNVQLAALATTGPDGALKALTAQNAALTSQNDLLAASMLKVKSALAAGASAQQSKQEVAQVKEVTLAQTGLTQARMAELEASRAQRLQEKQFLDSTAGVAYGMRPGEKLATAGMFAAAAKDNASFDQHALQAKNVEQLRAVEAANAASLVKYKEAEAAKREELRKTNEATRAAKSVSVAATQTEMAVKHEEYSALQRGEAKIAELMSGRNKLTRQESIDTLRAIGWAKEHEAVVMSEAEAEKSSYLQKLQINSGLLSGKAAISQADVRQATIEKRDMELWLMRGAQQNTLLKEKAALEKAAAAATHHGGQTSLVVREPLVMLRELSRGDMTRLAGSATIFTQAMGKLSLLVNPITILTAVIGGQLVYSLISAAKESAAMNNAIASTGNFANQTAGSMRSLAETITATSTLTIGEAKDVVTQLVASGQIGEQSLASVAQLADKLATSTGKNAADVAPLLAKMFADPQKGAIALNNTMHMLDATDLDYIRTLQEEGREEEARVYLARKTQQALSDVSNAIDTQGSLLDDVRKKWSAFQNAMSIDVARAFNLTSATQQLADYKAQLASLKSSNNILVANRFTIGPLEGRIAALQKTVDAEDAARKANAARSAQNQRSAEIDAQYSKLTAGQIETAQNKIKGLDTLITSNEALMQHASGDNLARLKKTTDEAVAVKRDEQIRLQQLYKSEHPASPHVTGIVEQDVVGMAKQRAAFEETKNLYRNKADALRKMRDDEIITHKEYIVKERELQAEEHALEIKNLQMEKTHALGKARTESQAALASGQPEQARNIMAAGQAKAIQIQSQIDITNANIAYEKTAKGELLKAEKDDRIRYAEQAIQVIRQKELAATVELAAQEEAIKGKVAMGQIRKQDAPAMLLALEKQKQAIAMKSLEDQVALYHEDDAQYGVLMTQEVRLRTQQAKQLRQIAQQEAQLQSADFKTMMDSAQNGLAQTMTNIVMHTQTTGNALRSMVLGFEQTLTSLISKNIAQQLMTSIFGTGGSGGTSGGNFITTMLGSLLTATGGTGGAAGAGASGGNMIGNAIWSFGGMLNSFAVGADHVPSDMVAQIHQGERIVPSTTNQDLTNYLSGAHNAKPSVTNNFTVSGQTDKRTQAQLAQAAYRGMTWANMRNG